MKSLSLCLALVAACGASAFAADADYDDPGMHYSPPAGWEKLTLTRPPDADSAGSQDEDDKPPVAIYAWHRGQSDQRTIGIVVKNFDGDLDTFERAHEAEVRKASDGTFVDKPIRTATANGMPAYLLKATSGTNAGHFTQRFEYLMIDGTRSIDVLYSGRQGDFSQEDAVAAFSSLYVVAFPRHRP